MSVLNCQRNGCENIMCKRYSYECGYICDECFEELVRTRWVGVSEFMNSIKNTEIFEARRSNLEKIFILDES